MGNKNMEDKSLININRTKGLVLTGLLFAIAIVLSIIENSLPSIVIGVSGVKLGLSNIAVMYTLFFLTKQQAFIVAILKSSFVFMTRGVIAGALSLSGGILSLIVMIILMLIFKKKISYLIISIFGAVFHNVGQLFAVSLIFTSIYIWAYLPVLLFAGVLAGIATSTLLKFILPAFEKLGLK
ncbi:heptaprenyl diphosphate synthase [Mobilisporobacter senegalensis]|uniref:Heptaprenyl diphosphate synthase n=1 Tax=Mobilisporobacter senegalensis TaxID=1329262 RepID=A0A3N1XLS6_9FIRM|nr:Gx transporter family protein [Mobilisporobacter senegalensis]ROR25677.1 heptaprenyl diphosphate synthase [Mobilisporobacter senegalensis]